LGVEVGGGHCVDRSSTGFWPCHVGLSLLRFINGPDVTSPPQVVGYPEAMTFMPYPTSLLDRIHIQHGNVRTNSSTIETMCCFDSFRNKPWHI